MTSFKPAIGMIRRYASDRTASAARLNEADVTFVPNVDINGQQDTTKNGILFVMDISGPRQGCEDPPVMSVYKVCNSDGSGC